MITAGATPEEVERFWAKVERRGDDECWLWTATTSVHGTPTVSWGGQNFTAARVAWELVRGKPVPPRVKMNRSCDEIRCVNPAHRRIDNGSAVQRMPEGSKLADATDQMLERFWGKVDKRGENECWLWTGSCSPAPNLKWGGKLVSALRIMWELEKGEAVPQGVQIRRTCGCTVCVNPAHLKLHGRAASTVDDYDGDRGLNIYYLAGLGGFDLVPTGRPDMFRLEPTTYP